MDKPVAIDGMYDYIEAREYISSLLGEDIEDFDGLLKGKPNARSRCFFHYLYKHIDIRKGMHYSFVPAMGKPAEEWQTTILNKFIEEFGQDATYYFHW